MTKGNLVPVQRVHWGEAHTHPKVNVIYFPGGAVLKKEVAPPEAFFERIACERERGGSAA